MDNITSAQQALTAEIKKLAAEQSRLERILAQLTGSNGNASATSTSSSGSESQGAGKRRGRKPKARPQVDESALSAALDMIRESGRSGISAIRLASQLKKSGSNKPDKLSLLGTNKVRISGNGGAATYTWQG